MTFGKLLTKEVSEGGWIMVEYSSDGSLAGVYMAVVLRDEPSTESWIPAYTESDKIIARCPRLDPNTYVLWAKPARGTAQRIDRIKVVT